jgi:hypothetical protein
LYCVRTVNNIGVAICHSGSGTGEGDAVHYKRRELSGSELIIARYNHLTPIPKNNGNADVGQKLADRIENASDKNLLSLDEITLINDLAILGDLFILSRVGLHQLNS